MIRGSRQWLKGFAAEEAGAALVEMTIITPLMLTLAAGVFEFSNIIQTKLLIEAGVRDAALYFARCGSSQAVCEANAIDIAVTGASGSDRVAGFDAGMVSVTYTPVSVFDADGTQIYRSNEPTLTIVEVTASYPYGGTGLWAYLGFGALTLPAAHEERVLGH